MEFVSMGWKNQMGSAPSGFSPSDLANLELWTKFNSGITVTGSDVDQWDDVSGNGNHLKQATALDKPQKQADGSILFDGIRQFLKADAFTLVQPETIYLLGKQITYTSGDRLFSGEANNSGDLYQNISGSPDVAIVAGGTGTAINTEFTLDTYAIVAVEFNGASSLIQINNGAPTTGDPGSDGMGGFQLGRRAAGGYGNIQIKEVLIYSTAHDAATRAKVIAYLSGVGGL